MVADMDRQAFHRQEVACAQQKLGAAVAELANHTDPILQNAIILRLAAIHEELQSLARGKVVFAATEAWRTLYEQILCSPDVKHYRSVAWLKTEDYWRDAPGRRSMALNYELLEQGVSIDRIFILSDFFWPPAAQSPGPDICRRIDYQQKRGIRVGLVRESAIAAETDLLCDMGIYGTRATGTLELDDECRTVRFTFDFSQEGVRLAEQRWDRLTLYAAAYAHLLDRREGGA